MLLDFTTAVDSIDSLDIVGSLDNLECHTTRTVHVTDVEDEQPLRKSHMKYRLPQTSNMHSNMSTINCHKLIIYEMQLLILPSSSSSSHAPHPIRHPVLHPDHLYPHPTLLFFTRPHPVLILFMPLILLIILYFILLVIFPNLLFILPSSSCPDPLHAPHPARHPILHPVRHPILHPVPRLSPSLCSSSYRHSASILLWSFSCSSSHQAQDHSRFILMSVVSPV